MLVREADRTRSRAILLLRIALVALAYYASGRLGLSIPYVGSFVTLVWMPTGVAVAAMFRWGPAMGIGVFIGAAAVNLSVGGSTALALAIAIGNTLGPGLAAYLLQRAGFDPSFRDRGSVLQFLLIGALGGMLITATNGVTMLALFAVTPLEKFASTWLVWWIGDAVGVLLAGVPLLAVSRAVWRRATAGWRGVEIALVTAAALVFSATLFFGGRADVNTPPLLTAPLLFASYALVVWLALRGGVLAGAVTVLSTAVLAAAGTAQGLGPFYAASVHFGLIQLWGHITTLAVINLIICALVSESARSQQRLDALFEHSYEAILLTRPDGTILTANPAAATMFGMSETGLRARGTSGLIDPNDARLPKLLAERDSMGCARGQLTMVRKDGARFEAEVTLARYRSEEGELLSHGIMRDVTERQRTLDALADREQRLRLALAASSQGLYDLDLRTGNATVNEEYARMLGYEPAHFRETNAAWIERLHPDDVERVSKVFREYVAGAIPEYRVEFRQRLRDEGYKWILSIGRVVERDAQGRPLRMLGTHLDIDDRKHAEATLKTVNAELERRVQARTVDLQTARDAAERASRAKSDFLSRMSHELRTPLNAILGFAQILRLRPETATPAQRAEYIAHIEKAGWHLLELIDEVLDLSRVESGRMSVSRKPVQLQRLCAECLRLVQPLTHAAGIAVYDHTVEVEPLSAFGDRTRLNQVLMNLLSNAVKYNRRGGSITLTLKVLAEDWVELGVEDTGPGLTAEQLRHLYEPFNRLGAETSATEGTGIGLVVSKRLTELMGGRLDLATTEGVGSRFTIRLKRAPEMEAASEVPQAPAEERLEPARTGETKVLYIEDDPSNVDVVRSALQLRPGIQVIEAPDGPTGLEIARTQHPGVILIDIALPGIDGHEVCRRLRARAETSATPIIAVSANAMQADIDKGKQAGFDAYLTKPIDVEVLLAHIDGLLSASNSHSDDGLAQRPVALRDAINSAN